MIHRSDAKKSNLIAYYSSAIKWRRGRHGFYEPPALLSSSHGVEKLVMNEKEFALYVLESTAHFHLHCTVQSRRVQTFLVIAKSI